MKREAYVEFNDFPKPITGSFLTNEQAEQFKNAFKDFVQVIRCKDCIHGGIDSASYPHYWCSPHSEYHEADWYCADGERR